MKLVAISAAILCAITVTTLSGCEENSSPEVFMNPSEKFLMKDCERQTLRTNVSCNSSYRETRDMARKLQNQKNPDDTPFKHQGLAFILEDKAFQKQHPGFKNMNETWYQYTGKWLYPSSQGQAISDSKKVDEKYVLSPQMYDELINAAKTCNRAAVSGMQFEMGTTLSPEDYDKVMTIIIDCKKYQFEKAINEK